jgi:sulfide:quinone oxidoreductase
MFKHKKVVVAGGGIAGVEAAIYASRKGFDTLLISDRDYLFVYPLAIWIPVRKIDYSEACIPLAAIGAANGFRVLVDRVAGLATQNNAILLEENAPIHYDYLVLATGAARTRTEGDEHIHSICDDPRTSISMRDALDAAIARGSGKIAVGFGGNPLDGTGVRGGPAFEIVFNIDTRLKQLGIRDRFQLSFFAPMENPGSRLGVKPAAQFAKALERASVNRHFGKKITRFSQDGVHLADQSLLPADVVFFIPARKGHPSYREWGLPVSEAGFIEADEGCRVSGFDDIFAVGDAATLHGPAWKAKQGHLAEVMARTAIHNVELHAKGKTGRHSYVHHVSILCLMDTGRQGVLVYRDPRHEIMLPLFHAGHALKKAWGFYYKNTKLGKITRRLSLFDRFIAGKPAAE